MCFYYGYLDLIVGMKLPKYNLCYNTRDLIKSLAENANDRMASNVLADFCSWPMAGNLQSLIFTDQSDGEYSRKAQEMCENLSQLYQPS